MRLVFHKPTKKTDHYVSSVTTTDGKPLRLTINFAKHISLNDQVMRVWIPESASIQDTFREFDQEALYATLVNNTKWFSNALHEDAIRDLFRSSVTKNVIAFLVSNVRLPTLYYKRERIESLDDIPLVNSRLTVELEAQGLYFFSRRFGFRWILRTLRIEPDDTGSDKLEDSINKVDIESAWETELQTMYEKVDSDIEMHRTRIKMLEDFKGEMTDLFDAAKKESGCTDMWNEALALLAHKQAKYYSGALFYLQ
jgi:hypothetical protein